MAETIDRLTAADYDEAIAMMDLAFGHSGDHTFTTLIASLYKRTDEAMAWNLALRCDGKIVSVVGVYPFQWQVGQTVLNVAGIGGVSVHPDYRRRGYMHELMTLARDEVRSGDYELSFLGGQRQRYAYYGWEKAGTTIHAHISEVSLRHALDDATHDVKVELLGRDDAAALATLKSLHDALPAHCIRPAGDFYDYVSKWYRLPFVARDSTGRIVGYAVTDKSCSMIWELAAVDDDAAVNVVRAVLDQSEVSSINVVLSALAGSARQRLTAVAENYGVHASGNWQVIDWPATLTALLAHRHEESPLPAGSMVLGIGDQKTSVRLTVDAAGPHCETTQAAADVSADALTMTRLLFGPLSATCVMDLPPAASILQAWCPLPAALSSQDGI